MTPPVKIAHRRWARWRRRWLRRWPGKCGCPVPVAPRNVLLWLFIFHSPCQDWTCNVETVWKAVLDLADGGEPGGAGAAVLDCDGRRRSAAAHTGSGGEHLDRAAEPGDGGCFGERLFQQFALCVQDGWRRKPDADRRQFTAGLLRRRRALHPGATECAAGPGAG